MLTERNTENSETNLYKLHWCAKLKVTNTKPVITEEI